MAAQQQDNGPYTLHGRRTEHEAEVRVGSHDDLDKAKSEAEDMVDSGVWHQATVQDRDSKTVHQSRKDDKHDPTDTGGGYQPAA